MINEKLLLKYLDRCIELYEEKKNPDAILALQGVKIFVQSIIAETKEDDKPKDLFE